MRFNGGGASEPGQQKIGWVHFRNVAGTENNFREVFIDEGQVDMREAVEAYKKAGFHGPYMMDHTPSIPGAGGKEGMAYAVGYIRALLQVVYHDELQRSVDEPPVYVRKAVAAVDPEPPVTTAVAARFLVVHGKGCEQRGLTPELIAGWGPATMQDYTAMCVGFGEKRCVPVECFHSTDAEAVAAKLDASLSTRVSGVVLNPGGWTSGGTEAEPIVAALGRLSAAGMPVVETHISNPTVRGPSLISPHCRATVRHMYIQRSPSYSTWCGDSIVFASLVKCFSICWHRCTDLVQSRMHWHWKGYCPQLGSTAHRWRSYEPRLMFWWRP